MAEKLRPATAADAGQCGRICFEAFASICDAHNFPRDFPSPEIAAGLLGGLISHPGFYGVVAEQDGKILGSDFLDERSAVVGIGPVSVDPGVQNKGTGRALMQQCHRSRPFARRPGHKAVAIPLSRPVFVALHLAGVSRARGPVYPARQAAEFPFPRLRCPARDSGGRCRLQHAVPRGARFRSRERTDGRDWPGLRDGGEYLGQITGYTTGIAFFAHTVCRTNRDLQALIGAASAFGGPGFLLPTRNYEVFAWCLANGLRVRVSHDPDDHRSLQ